MVWYNSGKVHLAWDGTLNGGEVQVRRTLQQVVRIGNSLNQHSFDSR